MANGAIAVINGLSVQSVVRLTARTRLRIQLFLFALMVVMLVADLSSHNQCGNEQRNWQTLTFPKVNYCSVPAWLPINPWFEKANKPICKVHDNNSGIYGTISQREADFRFLCDYLKRSEMPWGLRQVSGVVSYLGLRIVALANGDR